MFPSHCPHCTTADVPQPSFNATAEEIMALSINVCPERNVAVVTFPNVDKFTSISTLESLGRELKGLSLDEKRVVIDLENVERLSSEICSGMLSLHKSLNAAGGSLILCSLRRAVQEHLEITKLDNYFTIRANLEAALEAF